MGLPPYVTTPDPGYRRTLFDRMGPDAGLLLRAAGYALVAAPAATVMFALAGRSLGLAPGWMIVWVAVCLVTSAAALLLLALTLSASAGRALARLTSGASTPYVEQFSYQQSLVMRGQVAEALQSFEELIARDPAGVRVRIRAAELYAANARDPGRALALFRQASRLPAVTSGDAAYLANRMADLLVAAGDPGRAVVELRRYADRYPGGPGAEHAMTAIASIKATLMNQDESFGGPGQPSSL
jgi:tetratricopeptide (TPR) repeat protein